MTTLPSIDMASDLVDTREPLTRERVVLGAIELADAKGLRALSMRALAKHLGFEVMSLYNHITNKTDLIQAMVDQVASEAERPPIGTSDWHDAIRANAIAVKTALTDHPWAASIWSSTMPGPERFRLMEWQLATMATADLDEETAHHTFHAVSGHTVGYAMQSAVMPVDDDLNTLAIEVMNSLDPSEFAHTQAHIVQHIDGHHGPSFEFVLDIILAAVSQR